MNVLSHLQNRSYAAAPDAAHRLEGVKLVFCGLPVLYPELAFQGGNDSPGALHMTGCSEADGDDMLSSRFQAKGIIKGGNPADDAQRNVELMRDVSQNGLGQIVIGIIRFL